LEGRLEKEKKRKEGSTSTTPWIPSTSSTLFMVSSRREVSISWIFLPRVICSFGEGWKDSLLMVIPSYVSKYKKPSPSSIIQESHRIPFYLSFWFIAKRKLKSNPFVSKEQGKKDWILNLLTMKALNLGAKDSISISWLYLYVLISLSLILNL